MILETKRTVLRNWRDSDLNDYHHLNSDPEIMRLFPFRRSLEESAESMETAKRIIYETGFGWAAIELKKTGQVIGISGLMINKIEHSMQFSDYEIGWRLRSEVWRQGLATEAAMAWLDYAFATLKEQAIIATAVHQNEASIAIMKKLGMTFIPPAFQYPFDSDDHIHLQPSVLYKITQDEWRMRKQQ